MKPVLRSLPFLAALAAAAQAAPFLAIGDSAELFLTGTAAVRADDNILLGAQRTDDVVYELTPGAELELGGKGRPGKGGLEYRARRLQYAENHVLDRWDSSARAHASYTDEATKLRFDAAYAQLSDNTFDLRPASPVVDSRSLLRRRDYSASASADFKVTENTFMLLAAQYDTVRPQTSLATDLRVIEVPVAYYFRVAPGSQLGLGFRYRDTQVGPGLGVDSHDLNYFTGLRGQLTSSISGTVDAGFVQRSFGKGRGQGSFGAHAALTYALNDSTRLVGELSNDFGTDPRGLARRDLRGSLSFFAQLGDAWSLSLKGGYTRAKHLGLQFVPVTIAAPTARELNLYSENWYEGGVTVGYALNSVVSFSGGYTYRQLATPGAAFEFTDQVFSLAIQLRY